MSQRRLLALILAACTLPALTSCATEQGSFADAWADSYDDTTDVFGKHFFNQDAADPYARQDGWTAQAGNTEARASRLLLNTGVPEPTRVPRQGQDRGDNGMQSFWDWLIDND